ncbi:MAG: hypothetical protein WD801_08130 [Gemmatimonadaceae bacterium]
MRFRSTAGERARHGNLARSSIAIALVSVVFAGTAHAQGGGGTAQPSCTGLSGDACQQAVDFFHYMAPQLGTAMTGGNTTLAQGGSMGGRRLGLMPRFAIGLRVNAVMGNVPSFEPLPVATPAARELSTETSVVPLPALDAAVGVFKGFPLALSNVGGVDLLLSAAYVPTYEGDNVNITPDKSLAFGYGVRVGLLQESLVVPGVGISYMIRKFPVTTLSTSSGGADMSVNDLDLQSNAWRLTVSKSLLLFGVAAGVGQDSYKASTSISASAPAEATITTPVISSNVTRTNYFVDLSMNLLLIKLVGTAGMVSGGDILTYNSYDNPADKSRVYGSVGIRVGL